MICGRVVLMGRRAYVEKGWAGESGGVKPAACTNDGISRANCVHG